MSSGGQGRRRNVGDIRAFLKWAVEEKGAPDRWFPINTKAEINRLVYSLKDNIKEVNIRFLGKCLANNYY